MTRFRDLLTYDPASTPGDEQHALPQGLPTPLPGVAFNGGRLEALRQSEGNAFCSWLPRSRSTT